MAIFTRPNQTKINILASNIVRARPTITNEIFENPGHTGTALFNPKLLVLESIGNVGAALYEEISSFAVLHAPNGAEIWFNAKKVDNAENPRPTEISKDTNSVVLMGGVRQRLLETVFIAQQIIDKARSKL